ncbi:MAG: hypothetical protein JW860_02755 [Sedimentisphaerales bacterium]|nr:hypothetical protein [Sedimentisphaerales bacterium]
MFRKIPSWLSKSIFYQVYPPSFYDSNGDGIGDIPGVIEKLDYIESLGCNALWLNPCFDSPFRDGGYDVADYYKVAPRYGTNRDLQRLFKEAYKRGIRVCLDLVPAHTSIDHPWFKQSCSAKKNKYSDYYIWTDDWVEDTGELKAVRGYAERNGSYIANFFWSQPALNYGFAQPDPKKSWQLPVTHPACRAVRAEMINIMRYWLDKGAAGFRVDMAYNMVKNDKDCQQTARIWRQVRNMLDKNYPDAAFIAEWCNPAQAIPAGFHVDFMLNWMSLTDKTLLQQGRPRDVLPDTEDKCFFTRTGHGDISGFLKSYLHHYQHTRNLGYISIPTGNHDLLRLSLGRTQKEIELAFALILTMPGMPIIYYGDEIGMKHLRNLPSKEGAYTRTGARTPMQWDTTSNAGFSKAAVHKLYLPIDPHKNRPTVTGQDKNPRSLLNTVRKLITLRKTHPALSADGEFIPLYAEPKKYPFVYQRQMGSEKFIIALNPSNTPAEAIFTYPYPINPTQLIMGSIDTIHEKHAHYHLKMPPISYAILKV